jgi:cell division protein FtsA
MRDQKSYTVLDLGTTKLACLVGHKDSSGHVQVSGYGEAPSKGMEKGEVVDAAEVARSIRNALASVRGSGRISDSAYISVTGSSVVAMRGQGETTLPGPGLRISRGDVTSALEAACKRIPASRELLHCLPQSYSVDGKDVKDPVDMQGKDLAVGAYIVADERSHLKAVAKALSLAKVRSSGLVYKAIASGIAVLRASEIDRGAIVIDIGGSTTDVAAFWKGSLYHAFTIPVGGYHVSNDLAVWLGSTFQVAEEVKLQSGHVDPQAVAESEVVHVPAYISGQVKEVRRREACHIIRQRMEEILAIAANGVEEAGYPLRQWGGVILTGGSAKLPGIAAMAQAFLRTPVRVGAPVLLNFAPEKLRDPGWASCAGTLMWAAGYGQGTGKSEVPVRHETADSHNGQGQEMKAAFKEWMKDILPA